MQGMTFLEAYWTVMRRRPDAEKIESPSGDIVPIADRIAARMCDEVCQLVLGQWFLEWLAGQYIEHCAWKIDRMVVRTALYNNAIGRIVHTSMAMICSGGKELA